MSVNQESLPSGRLGKYLYPWYASRNLTTSFGESLLEKRGKKSEGIKMSAQIANFLSI